MMLKKKSIKQTNNQKHIKKKKKSQERERKRGKSGKHTAWAQQTHISYCFCTS
jgi:hypothetical protein